MLTYLQRNRRWQDQGRSGRVLPQAGRQHRRAAEVGEAAPETAGEEGEAQDGAQVCLYTSTSCVPKFFSSFNSSYHQKFKFYLCACACIDLATCHLNTGNFCYRLQTQTLGEVSDEDDTSAWVKRSRASDQQKRDAAKRVILHTLTILEPMQKRISLAHRHRHIYYGLRLSPWH